MVQKLLLPFLLYGLIDIPFTVFRKCVIMHEPFEIMELLKMLMRVFFISGNANSNGPLWFLPVLMMVQLLAYPLMRCKQKWLIIVASLIMLIIGGFTTVKGLFRVGQVPSAFVLFVIGIYLKSLIQYLEKKGRKIQVGVCLVSSAAFVVTCWVNGLSETAARNFGNYYLLYYFVAVFATMALLTASMLIKENYILEFFGVNSLTVMCCHFYFAVYISAWIMQAGGCIELRSKILIEIVLSLLTMFLMYFVVLFVNRWLPALTGKRELKFLSELLQEK